jgi:hypothetical protein
MPEDFNQPPDDFTPFKLEWLAFSKDLKKLIVHRPDDSPLSQYLTFRDLVFALVEDEKFLNQLKVQYNRLSNDPTYAPENVRVLNALITEMQAFRHALEMSPQKDSGPPNGKLLARASTTVRSAKDLFDEMPWWAKNSLTLFKELIDVYRV